MSHHFRLLTLLLLSACSTSQGGLTTIEDAEAYAQSRGVVLTNKKEDLDQRVAPRSYGYKANGSVDCDVIQFASTEAATTWKKAMDSLPMGTAVRIQKGPVVLAVWGATDAERQKVVDALK